MGFLCWSATHPDELLHVSRAAPPAGRGAPRPRLGNSMGGTPAAHGWALTA